MKAVYSYDGAGRLAGLETARGMVSYSYDSLGRLASKKLPNEAVTEYLYNETGRVTGITHKGADFTESCSYTYDAVGNKISADRHGTGMADYNGKYSYAYDELNRLTEVSKDGNIRSTYAFDEFGVSITEEEFDEHEKSLQPFGYTGYQRDEVSGLYFAQARMYDAWNGRFVSEDLHKGYKSATYTLNQYSYG